MASSSSCWDTLEIPSGLSWENWRNYFTKHELWRPVVRAVCQHEQFPCDTVEETFPGSVPVYVVDNSKIVKLFPPFTSDDYKAEAEVYQLLNSNNATQQDSNGAHATQQDSNGACLPVSVPKLFVTNSFVVNSGETWNYIVMQFLPGQAIRELYDSLTEEDMGKLGKMLGQVILRFHAVPLSGSKVFADGKLEKWHDWVRDIKKNYDYELNLALEEQGIAMKVELQESLKKFVSQLEPTVGTLDDPPKPVCLVHGDITEDHLLIVKTESEYSIGGIIDFADAIVGPPWYEFVAVWLGACNSRLALFKPFLAEIRQELPDIPPLEMQRMCMSMTCLHRCPGVITDWVAKQSPDVVAALDTVEQMMERMWPLEMFQ
eukprot:TRINITY_DN63046_c0_g1_i1.p1 TRINITY_DN63046_c0_g1~~TRINITY_DN63046_c0_g1_i1.p1  ORF type:complete len:374 (-),score=36.41 TRINITY_DN63046_c0_g1_i1:650-1771(-)